MAKKLAPAIPTVRIIKCASEEEAVAIEQMLNEGEVHVGVSVYDGTDVMLDQAEAAKPYGPKIIGRIKDAAKALRKLRRALAKHTGTASSDE